MEDRCEEVDSRKSRSSRSCRKSVAGAKTGELIRRHGISRETFYNWRRKYGGLKVDVTSQYGELLSPRGTSAAYQGLARRELRG